MNEAHQRFHDWLTAGADGDPPRDVAVHASVCAGCRRSIAALDLLAIVNPGLASMPGEPTGREHSRLAMAVRLVGATAILFSAAILGVGVSQLIGVSRTNGPVAQASPTPEQSVLGATATPQASPEPTATPEPTPRETLTPLGTPVPTHPKPVVTPIPIRTPPPTPVPTVSTAPTPTPTAPGAPGVLVAAPGAPVGIQLSWTTPIDDGGSPITSYRIYSGETQGGEAFLAEISPQTTYLDLAASSGTANWYFITAVNALGEGPVSNEASATAP